MSTNKCQTSLFIRAGGRWIDGEFRGIQPPGRRDELSAKWGKAQLDELLDEMNRHEFVLRFTLSHPACHTTIVGTADLDHLQANVGTAKAGPLTSAVYEQVKERLAQIGEEAED